MITKVQRILAHFQIDSCAQSGTAEVQMRIDSEPNGAYIIIYLHRQWFIYVTEPDR